MPLSQAQLADFSLGLGSLMSMSGVCTMPQWSNTSLYFVNPSQAQRYRMSPMVAVPGFATDFAFKGMHPFDPATRPDDRYEHADRLFGAWRSLQSGIDSMVALSRASRMSDETIEEIANSNDPKDYRPPVRMFPKKVHEDRFLERLEAAVHPANDNNPVRKARLLFMASESLDRLEELDKEAMLAESAAHILEVTIEKEPELAQKLASSASEYRELAIRAWIDSIKTYHDSDRIDRFRLNRSIWNAWRYADKVNPIMGELMLTSAQMHADRSEPIEAVADRQRLAWYAFQEGLDPRGWLWLESLLSMIAANWKEMGFDAPLSELARGLADDAMKFSQI